MHLALPTGVCAGHSLDAVDVAVIHLLADGRVFSAQPACGLGRVTGSGQGVRGRSVPCSLESLLIKQFLLQVIFIQ